jgi:PRTRC genetic system protein A
VTLDPRDAILQSHTPAIMVPRFGEIPPLENNGHRYLVAQDGLWLDVKRPWIEARVPAGGDLGEGYDGHRLPFGPIKARVVYMFGATHVQRLQRRFLVDAVAALPNEFAAWGVFDELTYELSYRRLIAINAGPAGIEFHRPKLEDHEHLAVDIHSHGTQSDFFSETDDEDDRGEVKLALVAGNLNAEVSWSIRLCLLGIFMEAVEA